MKKNPWKVKSIQAFAFLNCPECDFNTKEVSFLQDHVVQFHSISICGFFMKSIQSFSFLKCPECDFVTTEDNIFQDHAVKNHPLSFVLFGKIKSLNISSIITAKETEEELKYSIRANEKNAITENPGNVT